MRVLMALLVASGSVLPWTSDATAQDRRADVRNAMGMLVFFGMVCGDYTGEAAIAAGVYNRGRSGLADAGIADAEAVSFLDQAIDAAKGTSLTETDKQAACRMIGM